MPKEVERKFLVKEGFPFDSLEGTLYRQGYLSCQPDRVVRVRLSGDQGYLTIKGKASGASRAEYEYPIPAAHAREILDKLCIKPLIEKVRYRYSYKGHVWEVDRFLGENEGLVLAEIELENENEAFEKPEWLGEEVTGDPRYFNSNLVEYPYGKWGNKGG